MPRSQYQSYGKRGPHHNQRGHPVPSHSHHNQLQRTGSAPAQPPAPAPVTAEPSAPPSAALSVPAVTTSTTPTAAAVATANEFTPQSSSNYEQVVRYAKERWSIIKKDLIDPPDDRFRRIEYYVEKGPNSKLKDFIPYNLEAFAEQQRLKREKAQQNPPPPSQ